MLKMTVSEFILIILLTHVIAYTTKRVNLVEFIKAVLCIDKEEEYS